VAEPVSICNRALMFLGVNNIISLQDDTKEARACSMVFYECFWEFLGEADWSFATKTRKLTATGEAPDDTDYTYEFELPTDFLRALQNTGETVKETVKWELVGNKIYANENPITLTYIHGTITVMDMQAKARAALAYLIASQIAISLTGNPQLATLAYELYQKTLIDVLAADARTKKFQPEIRIPFTETRW